MGDVYDAKDPSYEEMIASTVSNNEIDTSMKQMPEEIKEETIEKALKNVERKPKTLGVKIGKIGGFILIAFDRPVTTMNLTKKEAREFGARLIKEAQS